MNYKCKCDKGWIPTKKHSLVEQKCFICSGTGEVDEERAEAFNISTKPKNQVKNKVG